MTDIYTFLVFWLLILSGDAAIGIVMYRIVGKKWVWQKDIKQPWAFSISPDGWSFSAQDFNPFETFRKMMSHIMGNDKQIGDIIKEEIEKSLKINARIGVDEELIKKILKSELEKVKNEYLNKNNQSNKKG